MKKFALLSVALFICLSGTAMAGKTLSEDEIKQLISGNTIHARHEKKGFDFKVYFQEDGTFIRSKDGDTFTGTWKLKDGMHCINLGGSDKCATMVENGGGSYHRMANGKKHIITWTKVVKGKDI